MLLATCVPISHVSCSTCFFACCRAGPRIFVGKLTKDTSEADVKDYFMRFGYVMDVYLPKSKENKVKVLPLPPHLELLL